MTKREFDKKLRQAGMFYSSLPGYIVIADGVAKCDAPLRSDLNREDQLADLLEKQSGFWASFIANEIPGTAGYRGAKS